MEIGMLWFDDSRLKLEVKISKAVSYYQTKYERRPTHCFLHPQSCEYDEAVMAGVLLQTEKTVMPGYFWIGIDEEALEQNSEQCKAA